MVDEERFLFGVERFECEALVALHWQGVFGEKTRGIVPIHLGQANEGPVNDTVRIRCGQRDEEDRVSTEQFSKIGQSHVMIEKVVDVLHMSDGRVEC